MEKNSDVIGSFDKFKKLLNDIDDQICLWNSLRDLCLEYIEAIIICKEQNISLSSLSMKNINSLLSIQHIDTIKTLFNPIESCYYKLKKVYKTMEKIQQKAENLRETIHDNNYIHLFIHIKQSYYREFVNLGNIIKHIPLYSNEKIKDEIDEFKEYKYTNNISFTVEQELLAL